jgi:hypothetical protein
MALVNLFPRYIARVVGGMRDLLYETYLDGCQMQRISVFGVHFAKLNDNGAFHRIFDPTVGLAASDLRRKKRSWKHMLKDVLLDQAPRGRNEYLLSSRIGGSKYKIERYRRDIQQKMPRLKRIKFIVDRAECLVAHPLSLWLEGFPLGVLPLEVPENFSIHVDTRERSGPSTITSWTATTHHGCVVRNWDHNYCRNKFPKPCSETDT